MSSELADTSGLEFLAQPMKPRERVMRGLKGLPMDRPAAVNPTGLFNYEIMERVDACFPEVHLDPEKMTRLAESSHILLGLDTVKPVFCTLHEAAALGAEIDWGSRTRTPVCKPMAHEPDDIVIPKDWMRRRPITVILECLRELKRRHGDHAYIVGLVDGPWTIGLNVFGPENLMMMSLADPESTRKAMGLLKNLTLELAFAEIEAGADGLLLNDHASANIVSSECYRDYLMEIHSDFARTIPCPLILHICGYTLDRMPHIGQTGLAAFHFESSNPAKEALEAIGTSTKLVGNINNPTTLLAGTTDDVYAEVIHTLNSGIRMVAAECFGPLLSPTVNYQTISKAAEDYPRLSQQERERWGQRANVFDRNGDIVRKVSQ